MDGFTYQNIFDTKGIEYIVIIGFLLLLIPFWVLINRPVKQRAKARAPGYLRMNRLRVPAGLFYSRNHTWAYMESSGITRIGIDDFLIHSTGAVEVGFLRSPGDKIRKGDPIAKIYQDGKQLLIRSTVSGEVRQYNSRIEDFPESLGSDPYGAGWLYKVLPLNWTEEIASCYFAESALEWMDKEITRLRDFIAFSLQRYSPEPGIIILQEGGELADHPLSELPEGIWKEFQGEFLETLD
jgi:glycine cleavage system H protein